MLILVPAPYLPEDKQDANHIRVYHHHAVGLSGESVRIYGPDHETVREVRCTSGVRRTKPFYSGGGTLLVHLKALPIYRPRLQCSDIDLIEVLKIVQQHGREPTRLEWLGCLWNSTRAHEIGETDIGCRLFDRKWAAMLRKNLVQRAPLLKTSACDQMRVTEKGLRRLESK